MTAQNRTVLKSYFETGDKPTQGQFVDLIDSFPLISETSAFVQKSGDTMTGLLILSGNPAVALGAATKQYVDSNASIPPFVDTTALVKGSVDATKLVRLEVDGNTTGTTRVITPQDADGTIAYTTQLGDSNILINPAFYVNERTLATNADDTYAHDCWYVLTQTGTIAVSTITDVENTTPRMARLTQSQASAQRMGYAQIMEGRYCKQLRGQTVNLKMRYRCSSSQAVRFAILEWTGTEDSVTSDVVNDWTSGTYTAGNFFLASNLTVTSVTAATPSANTLTDFTVSATLGSSFNNLIVFMWTEATIVQNATLDFGKVYFNSGTIAPPVYYIRPYELELALCRRYCWVYTSDTTGAFISMGQCSTTTAAYVVFPLDVQPRTKFTGVTVSSAGHFNFTAADASGITCATLIFNSASQRFVAINGTVASGLIAGNATTLYVVSASGKLTFTGAEL